MAHAVAQAAVQAGLEIVLLPAAYHRNGWDGGDRPPEPGQLRFCDANVETFLARVDALLDWAAPRQGISVGIAAHSVRAVPAAWLEAIARYADAHGLVRHIHAHEQRRELDECAAEHGCSPIELLDATGFLDSRASVIHGIHVTDADVSLLARSGATVVSCPTTEGNLGDGYLPAMAYAQAGVPLAVGSDSQVRIDPFEEARELETLSRRERQLRSGLLAASGGQLWEELCAAGRASLGLSDRGTDAEAGAQPRAVRGASGAQRGARGAQRGARGAQPGAPSAQRGAQLRCEVDLDHPDLRGINPADLHLALVTCASAGVVVGGAGRAARSPGGPSGV
jgi:formimidoylglutamate deiminase